MYALQINDISQSTGQGGGGVYMIGFGSDKNERVEERERVEREREGKERWRPQGSRLPACGRVEGAESEGLWAPQHCFD